MNDIFMKARGKSEVKGKAYSVLLPDADDTVLDF